MQIMSMSTCKKKIKGVRVCIYLVLETESYRRIGSFNFWELWLEGSHFLVTKSKEKKIRKIVVVLSSSYLLSLVYGVISLTYVMLPW